MLAINKDMSIHLTRGDVATIEVNVSKADGTPYTFKAGDIVRFKVFEKRDCGCVALQKDTEVKEETTTVEIGLAKGDTKIGELINKPTDYWYEIELNPDTAPQTVVGYDETGPKLFRLYPEGSDVDD